jgi:hypothetical protein
MCKQCGVILGLLALLASPAIAGNDYYFGNFEEDVQFNGQYVLDRNAGAAGGFRGWFDWNGNYNPPDPPITSAAPSTEFGVTTGQYSLAWVPTGTGYHQGLSLNVQNLPPDTRGGFFDAFFSNTHIAMNITWNNDEWFDRYNGSDWNGASVGFTINYGPGGTFQGQGAPDIDTGNAGTPGGWDLNNYPGVHNRIVQWDYSALKPAIQAAYTAGTLNETNGWLEFILETTTGNFLEGVTFYVDSWRLTDNIEDTVVDGDFNEDGTIDAADYVAWRKSGLSDGDYNIWVSNFGEPSSAAGGGGNTGGVPEPTSVVLVAIGACLVALRRRGI